MDSKPSYISGKMHYQRVPKEYGRDRMQGIKNYEVHVSPTPFP